MTTQTVRPLTHSECIEPALVPPAYAVGDDMV